MWLMAERVVAGLLAVSVTVAVARHLGPSSFGTLSFALSLVLLFSTLWTLGLSGIVVRELVRHPDEHGAIVGTVTVLRVAGGVIAVVAAVALTVALDVDPVAQASVAILMIGVLALYTFDGIDLWLQAEVRSRYAVAARTAGLACAAAFNVALIAVQAEFMWFVIAAASEFVIGGLALVAVYVRLGKSFAAWRFRVASARSLLRVSWPLVLSGVVYAINLRVDQLMLGTMSDTREVGLYAAAARLSEVWYFVPAAIAASVFPAMIRSREAGPVHYEWQLARLYDAMVALGLPVALAVALGSSIVVELLYGPAYAKSGAILAIHIWAGPFVFLGSVLSRALIAEDRLGFSFVRHGAGALVNVVLNLVLIPPLGGVGAAWATLISYTTAAYLATFLYGPVRRHGVLMTRALLLPIRATRAVAVAVWARSGP
jgi:PST family polysaccharide transporter